VEARPVGFGASCCMCSERRREHLRSVELLGNWVPLCHNCGARAARLTPMPQSLGQIRVALTRDRRTLDRRRGRDDTRVFQHDRRSGDRRNIRLFDDEDCLLVEDEMILEIEEIAMALSREGDDAELTCIRELPA
jgi:hypothetical protein